jgi:hypothetical protein
MLSPAVRSGIRCRQIVEDDLDAVIDLLTRGFPGRTREYWTEGLRRHATRPLPPNCPSYGYVLDHGGVLVGVILVLCSRTQGGEAATIRCNFSSWYVEPAFRSHATLLTTFALKDKNATYVNISPARHTWPTVEAHGFVPYCNGQFFALPALGGGGRNVAISRVTAGVGAGVELPAGEIKLLSDHADYGCISLVCSNSDGAHPFVFVPYRIRSGRITLPCLHLAYCRQVADFVRLSGPLGRYLLKFGTPLVAVDANGPVPGLIGFYRDGRARKYFKGPNKPRLGDLAYTERALFGP